MPGQRPGAWSGRPSGGRTGYTIPEFLDIQEQAHSFDQIIAADDTDVLCQHGERTERLQGGLLSTNAFAVLGMKPLVGRYITADDGKPDAPAVFVMSYKMWLNSYNRSAFDPVTSYPWCAS